MCGIAGVHSLHGGAAVSRELLLAMIARLRHRGPDGRGLYLAPGTGLAHARLSIIDVGGGGQPMANEDGTVWITFNGEIFNYCELRPVLEARGHRFSTRSDTEAIIHCYEEYGVDCLRHLNGQFAFAIHDRKRDQLFLARDRAGIRPLFHATIGGQLLFASEVKALFADPRVPREIDPRGLDQVFTYWTTIAPRTAFRGISELPAGHYLLVRQGEVTEREYWDLDLAPDPAAGSDEECSRTLRDLLVDATRIQLRADVPVGAYLSGGLDSSAIAALIKTYSDTPLRTFSVAFSDEVYDESEHQQRMISRLGTDHSVVRCTPADIGAVFPDVVWHAEKPLVRTAAAPFFLLSRLVRESGYKVVLTGEGSDEVLLGYDLYKEVKIRSFLARQPRSAARPLILKRLYPYLAASPVRSLAYAESFFTATSEDYPAVCRSHFTRWGTTARTKLFFSPALKAELAAVRPADDLAPVLAKDLAGLDDLGRAQYLEMKTLLAGYLLSSQGDRVAMAHSIEGRYPFLDHRIIEYASKVPARVRMRALREKSLLKRAMEDLLPQEIVARTKQPYMAPDAKSFVGSSRPDYVDELLSEERLRAAGFFDPRTVAQLVRKCGESGTLGFKDNMALVGILSTQLLHDRFVRNFGASEPCDDELVVCADLTCDREQAHAGTG